jgi:restriction system protein
LLAKQFKLTEAEVAQRFPSGSSTILANRSGWATTFRTKTGLIQKVSPKTDRATPAGLGVLKSHSLEITEADLKELPRREEAWEAVLTLSPISTG